MKAKELMIGDWVHIIPISKKVKPHDSIVGALTRNPNDTISIEGFYEGHFGWSVCEEDIEPIPLTEEILNANGFSLYSDKYKGVFKYGCFLAQVSTCADLSTTYEHDIIFECAYVHELQHALRICGMNELADNFKIE